MGKINYRLDNKVNNYFIKNYECIFSPINLQNPSIQTIYIDDKNGICRFCGKTNKEVSFSEKCHAVPEFFGNKNIITKNECNECNHKYADMLEDDLSKLTLPSRNMTRVYGKNGIPKYKDIKTNNKCEYKDGRYIINNYDHFFEIREEDKQVILKFDIQTMILLKAYKAFVRIALNCMPKEYFDQFKNIYWLESEEDLGKLNNLYTNVITKFMPKIKPMSNIGIFIRKEEISNVPYCQMVLQSNNMFYQVVIPFIEKDEKLENENVIIDPFSFGIEEKTESEIGLLRLSSNQKMSTTQEFVMNYESKELLDE